MPARVPDDVRIDFAILTAIKVEREAVCAAFGLTEKHRVERGGRPYWYGEISLPDGLAFQIVVAQQVTKGQVEAATLTREVLQHWRPTAALFVGIAGSTVPAKVRLGDVVVAKSVWYYEHGRVTPERTEPEPEMVKASAELLQHFTGMADWDGEVAAERPDGPDARPRVHLGVIASGEKVIADAAVRDRIAEEQREILAITMEDYGFSYAVSGSAERVQHLVIRGICDDASSGKNDAWHVYAATAVAGFARHFLLDGLPDRTNARADLPVGSDAPTDEAQHASRSVRDREAGLDEPGSEIAPSQEPKADKPSLWWLLVAMIGFASLLYLLPEVTKILLPGAISTFAIVTAPTAAVTLLTLLFARRHRDLANVLPEDMRARPGHYVTLYYGGNSARGAIFSNIGSITSITLFFSTIAPLGYLHPIWSTGPLLLCMILPLWAISTMASRAPAGTWTSPLPRRARGLAHFFERVYGAPSASVVHKLCCLHMLFYTVLELYLLIRILGQFATIYGVDPHWVVYLLALVVLLLPLVYVLARGYVAVLKTDGVQLGVVLICGGVFIWGSGRAAAPILLAEVTHGTEAGGPASMAVNLVFWCVFIFSWFATLPDFWIRNVATPPDGADRRIRVGTMIGMIVVSLFAYTIGKLAAVAEGGVDALNAKYDMSQRLDRSQALVLYLVEGACHKPLLAGCLLCLCVGAAMNTIDTYLLTILQVGWSAKYDPRNLPDYGRRRVLPSIAGAVGLAILLLWLDDKCLRASGRQMVIFQSLCVAFPALTTLVVLFCLGGSAKVARCLSVLIYGTLTPPQDADVKARRVARQLAVHVVVFVIIAFATDACLHWDCSGPRFWMLGAVSLILTIVVGYLVAQLWHAVSP